MEEMAARNAEGMKTVHFTNALKKGLTDDPDFIAVFGDHDHTVFTMMDAFRDLDISETLYEELTR